MALEDSMDNLAEQLKIAPPNQPTAADAEAQKANETANALSAATTTTPKTGFDNRQLASAAPAPSGPAPGSLGWHLANAFKTPVAQAPGGGTKALFSGVTDALLHGNDQQPPEQAGQPNAAWQAAQSNSDASRPTQGAPAAPRAGIFDNVLKAIGDARAGMGQRGVLQGAIATAGAMSDRQRQEQSDRVTMAHANSQMLHEQALTHKMGEDAIGESVKTGIQGRDAILNAHEGGELIADNKNSDEIKQMIDSKQLDPSKETVFLTGRVLTGKDQNGQPLYRSTYSVVRPHGDVEPSEQEAKFIKDNVGIDLKAENGQFTKVPAVQYNQLWQQASTAAINKRAFQVKEAQDQKAIDEAQNSMGAKQLVKSTTLTNALNAHTTPSKDGVEDPFATVKTYDYFMNNPAARAQVEKETGANNFSEAYIEANGGKQTFDKKIEEYAKAQQKNDETIHGMLQKAKNDPKAIEGHTPAYEAAMKSIINAPKDAPNVSDQDRKDAADVLSVVQDVKQNELGLEAKKEAVKNKAKEEEKGFVGDPNATTGEEFFKSLKPQEQDLVKQMGTGKMPIARIEYLASRKPELLEAVSRAYPGFDGAKISSYVSAYKDFTSGKTAVALNSGGTGLLHLHELQQLNTAASHIPGTPAWNAYENKADTVSSELAKFYGDASIPAIAAIKKTLMANLPGGREAAITTQAGSMGDKMDSFETTWNNAAPSKEYEALMPQISQKAKAARAALDPEYAASHPQFQPAKVPQNAVSQEPGKAADGTLVWPMKDGSIQDQSGNKYDPKTGKKL